MKTYEEFHGNIDIKEIGKKLRELVKKEKAPFKILTGYGSTCGKSQSKQAAIKSLSKMKREQLIKGFFPGEALTQLLTEKSPYYQDKLKYQSLVKNDKDYGNEGIIFIFV